MGDGDLRAAYLRQVLRQLYPGSSGPAPAPEPAPGRTAADGGSVDGGGSGGTAGPAVTEYLVVPHARAPRLLVPATPRVAAAAVAHYSEPQSRRARLQRRALIALLRSGAGRLALRDRVRVPVAGSVEEYLRRVLAEPVAFSIHIGPARANRKAVLQLLRPDGDPAGFAKVGTGPLTRALVRAETDALTTLADTTLRALTPPAVRHAGRFTGHDLLVQSPLPVWRPRAALAPDRLAGAMRELAHCRGGTEGRLAGSHYLATLRERVAAVSDHPDGAALAGALAALETTGGDVTLRYGAWHGDWTRWNMAVLADTLLVWDWERFATGVPVGFDAVHYDLHDRVHQAADPAGAVAATLHRVDDLLAPFDVAPAAREITALLYLTDLAARYLADRQAEAGARLGALGSWLLPVLLDRLNARR